jgi:hypothetical protein
MVACKYSGSCSLPLRDLSLLAARERMMWVLDVRKYKVLFGNHRFFVF